MVVTVGPKTAEVLCAPGSERSSSKERGDLRREQVSAPMDLDGLALPMIAFDKEF